ncbi:MAG: quinone-dependent dihydroorotate dehydrogenase [Flavobacteriales bacterium TMED288]|nr:dihydroorotate dehydrogenase (quinone) [Flavobacteriales bacterium]MAJ98689.1 dihydroorotate dehydrogenase (quinone) [Flavobacteriales bacterium]RPG53377.1 MAG: quinone-dependent dihydroorotate dehydrogenase [Flavobacteriales bacterium TMED288]|tara:strand:- start:3910 stop:4944 length:1035 start_codon:yes stop_codon:yes gene_type:complete
MYKKIILPFLFLFEAEKIHNFVLSFIRFSNSFFLISWIVKKIYTIEDKRLHRNLFGINFKNPVGLAAGFDKDASCFNQLSDFGFGFIEIGTVTPLSQEGNIKPRLFRLKKDNALINRMGFNNEGVDTIINRLKKKKTKIVIGGNIGKNKSTNNESTYEDYLILFNKLFDYVDYFVVNVSSPNTPGLRDLQDKRPLKKLLSLLKEESNKKTIKKPILVKISPDLNFSQLDDIIEIVNDVKIDGIIATNTTISRDNLKTSNKKLNQIGNGGLSGYPIKDLSNKIIKYIKDKTNGNIKIIGVGGINNESDALEKLKSGADLVQIYTGFIYQGPSIVNRICKKILQDI